VGDAATLEQLTADLVAALGAEQVSTSDAVRGEHAAGESYHRGEPPDIVVFPRTTADVVAVVNLCRTHGVPIVPFGSGTSLEGQVVALRGGVSLDTTRLDRILRLDVDDLDVTVEAGVTRKQLDARLRPEGVFFPVDPGADATIGGMVKAIECGYPQKEIAEASYQYQRAVEAKERIIVGANDYMIQEDAPHILYIGEEVREVVPQTQLRIVAVGVLKALDRRDRFDALGQHLEPGNAPRLR
jgi:hypothetical protein